MVLAAGSTEAALAFVEIGALALVLALLSRLAGRIGISAVPLYLLAGLLAGEGGIVTLDVSEDFITLTAEIGVLLLLLALGLEYTAPELQNGLRTGLPVGIVDMIANAGPGIGAGLLLGWDPLAAVLLGGVTWVSSSGVVSKVLSDLNRLGNRETPSILNVLVLEDLAMAVYLPVVAALVAGGSTAETTRSVVLAVAAVGVILTLAVRYGGVLTRLLGGTNDETLVLAVFGLTLLVAGLAQSIEVSGAIGAFLVGLALSDQVGHRAEMLLSPLRDLFAATFFVAFSFGIDPTDLVDAVVPALLLGVVTAISKFGTGWYAAARAGIGVPGRLRAATALIPRGEFSIVIAALGATLVDGPDLEAVAAGYVLFVAILGPIMARFSDRIPVPERVTRRVKVVTEQ